MGVCTAHTCGCGLECGFIRSAGSFVALQTALKGILFLVVARCRGQVMSSALPSCSAPEVFLLILPAYPTRPSWSGHSPVSSKPRGLLMCLTVVLGKTRSCCSASYGCHCPAGTWHILLVIPNVCGGTGGYLPPSGTSPISP